MGRAGAPGPSTAQAPKGKGFPCSAGPWRVHCPMHPARSAVAPGALEIGHGPLPQLSGKLGGWSGSSRSDKSAHCTQMATPSLSQPIPASVGASSYASASFRDLANHRTSSLPGKPIITRVSASVTARLEPMGARLAGQAAPGEEGRRSRSDGIGLG